MFINSAVIAAPKPMSEEEMGRNTASYYGGTIEEIEANVHKNKGVESLSATSNNELNLLPDTSSVALQQLSESYIRPKPVAAEPQLQTINRGFVDRP